LKEGNAMAEIVSIEERRRARIDEKKKAKEGYRELILMARELGRDNLVELFETELGKMEHT
jgi:hypothetical protein